MPELLSVLTIFGDSMFKYSFIINQNYYYVELFGLCLPMGKKAYALI